MRIIIPSDFQLFIYSRHQVQHYTNQLVKDTNNHLKELTHIPNASSISEQVSYCSRFLLHLIVLFAFQ